MAPNRLEQLHAAGQSIWLDYIDRTMLHNGDLERRIREDALTGMTSNPTIFEKALAEGHAYDAQLAAAPAEMDPAALFEMVETDDVRTACDRFLPVFERTGGRDGFVSIEVSPGVADDERATIEEARRLWQSVGRPNVMVKVPGTASGARAVRALIAGGVNVNITLLFDIDAHRRVLRAYVEGLEERVASGQPVDGIASVASFFVSRVDTEVDKRLELVAADRHGDARDPVLALRGKTAVANARLAYQLFREEFAGARWEALAARGARVQRPLWASTSTKNPAYRDVVYVEELIGPDTVNTLPPATLEAFRDHGVVQRTIDRDVAGARGHFEALARVGIDMAEVTSKLLVDGLASFQKSWDALLEGIAGKRRALEREAAAAR
jgi:transaldolase